MQEAMGSAENHAANLSKELLGDARGPVEAERQPLPGVTCGAAVRHLSNYGHARLLRHVLLKFPVFLSSCLPVFLEETQNCLRPHAQLQLWSWLTEVGAVHREAQRQQPLLWRPGPQIVPQQRHTGCAK